MFLVKKLPSSEPTGLQNVIDALLADIRNVECDSHEYSQKVDQLVKLMKLQEEINSKKNISRDTLAIIAGNLIGIAMIISYERVHIVASKALGFVLKASR